MRRPFKMKGYSYPGKSPIKQETITKLPILPPEPLPVDTGGDEPLTPSSDEQTVTPPVEETSKMSELLSSDAGGQIVESLIKTGITTGVNALTQPKKRPVRRGGEFSGFSNIQFGRRS